MFHYLGPVDCDSIVIVEYTPQGPQIKFPGRAIQITTLLFKQAAKS